MTMNAHVDDLAAQLARTSLTPKQRDDPSSPDDTTRTTFVAPELAQSSPPLLTRNSSVTDVARYLKQVRPQRIAFLVGAGISVAAGIPDFRTPGVGLYDTLGAFALPYPEAIFDVEYFRRRPEPFFALARAMWPDPTHPVHFPTVIHHMMRIVHDEGTLFRVYTQNIDGLEELAGIPSHKLFQAHGTYRSARCIDCSAVQDVEAIRKVVQEGGIPRCQDCVTSKTLGGVDADGLPAGREGGAGLVKPDIVFFGEDLPSSFVHHAEDIKRADFAFIIGTSLNVQPFATLPDLLPSTVPRVLINREVVGCFSRRTSDRLKKSPGSRTDVLLTGGDCQEIAEQLIEAMGWTAQLRQLQERNIEHKGENEMMR